MRLLLTAAVVSLAIGSAACDSNTANDSAEANLSNDMLGNDGMNDMMAANDASAMALSPTDFVAATAGSDMYEIESGKLAQSKGGNQAVKSFGAMLVADHSKSSADLKTAAAGSTPPVTVPAALPADHQAKLDALKAASGADFDRLFVEQQTAGHQLAHDTLTAYSTGGSAGPLKDFAAKTAPVVKGHLDQLKSMKL